MRIEAAMKDLEFADTVTFFDRKNEMVGVLSVKDGVMSFEGDADESAEIFFKSMAAEFQRISGLSWVYKSLGNSKITK